MSFPNKLRHYRKKMIMTQKELADKLRMTQKTVSAWEVGRSEPTMGDMVKLCNIFDCTLEDLTDTRQRKVGEITLDDIYAKLDFLSVKELHDLDETINFKMAKILEKERIEKEKYELERRLAEMQRRLKELEKK